MESETQKPKKDPAKNRRIVLITAGVILFCGLYLLAFLVPDVLNTASGPASMSLEAAAEVANDESLYVSLEDGTWDCDTIKHIRRRSATGNAGTMTTAATEIFLRDTQTAPDVLVFATMSGEMTCGDFDGLTATGYLTLMSEDQQQDLANEVRLAKFINADTILALCGYCGTENSMIGLIFGIVTTLGGIAVLIIGLRMPKQV